MARTIQVNPAQLESAAGRIESLASDYKAQYDQLYAATSAMAATWKGVDNVAFVNQIDGFKEDFARMHELMLNYALYLRKTAKTYTDAQQTITSEARKLVN